MVQQTPTSLLMFQGRDILPFHLPMQFPPPSQPCLSLGFFSSLPIPFPGTAASLCMSHILVLGPQAPHHPSPTSVRLRSIYYALFTSRERKSCAWAGLCSSCLANTGCTSCVRASMVAGKSLHAAAW